MDRNHTEGTDGFSAGAVTSTPSRRTDAREQVKLALTVFNSICYQTWPDQFD